MKFRTLQSWARRGQIAERRHDGSVWQGVPWALPDTGLFSFVEVLERATRATVRQRVTLGTAA